MSSSTSSSTNINLATLTTAQGFSISGASTNIGSGFSVAGAGDVNSDGYADIIIGAPDSNGLAGISYTVYGGPNLKSFNLASITASQGFFISGITSSESGASVARAGDINNDGYADIIIGAPDSNSRAGISYVVYGGATLKSFNLASITSSQGFSISGVSNSASFSGQSVAGAGDVNGDGIDDVIIGAPYANGDVGISYVVYGEPAPKSFNLASITFLQEGFSISGAIVGGQSGLSVAGAGDVNGDGYNDVIIGAPYANNNVGISYVVYGGKSLNDVNLGGMTSSQGFSISGAKVRDFSGRSVAGAGDVNGDGYADIIIGADGANNNAGISYVVYGRSILSNITLDSMTSSQGFSISGAPANSYSGFSVAGAGDVNGDGIDDVIIGARSANIYAGISYVVYGGIALKNFNLTRMTSSQGFSISGASNYAESGFSVAGAGDVNGDGYNDVIIGAPYANSNAGTSYIIYGKVSPTTPPTPMPNQQTVVNNNYGSPKNLVDTVGFKIGFPVASFALSVIGGWFLRTKIAFYVLDNWGHNYKFIYNDKHELLKENEIGLRLNNNKLVCIVKEQEYPVLVDDNNNGISKGLHRIITQELLNPSSQSFTLIQPEKNQLLNFLITHKHLTTSNIGCFMRSYAELGCMKGFVYHTMLKQFEDEYFKASKKIIRPEENSKSITQDALLISSITDADDNSLHDDFNPIIENIPEVDSVDTNKNHDAFGINPNILAVHSTNYDKSLLNHPELSDILMHTLKWGGSEYVDKLIEIDDVTLGILDAEIKGNGIETAVVKFITETASNNEQAIPEYNVPGTNTHNDLMLSLFCLRQLVEYLPLFKYLSKELVYPLIGNDLPDSLQNISFPDLLANKPFLFTMHLAAGHAGAMIMPANMVGQAVVISTADSLGYGTRLMANHYLNELRQDTSELDLTKYCGTTLLAYTLPKFITCAVTKFALPGISCNIANYDLLASSSLGIMQCYNAYKSVTQEPSEITTADIVVPYVADAAAAYMLSGYFGIDTSSSTALMASLKNSMSVVAAVVATDNLARMVMNVAPEVVKESYLDCMVDYVQETCTYGINELYQIAGTVQHYFE